MKNDERPLLVQCSGGCGKVQDMAYQIRIGKRLGFKRTPTYQCAECFKVEQAKLKGAA